MDTGTGTRDDVIIPISDDPEWLFQIIKREDPPGRSKPRIKEVVETLSQIESNNTCFHPYVVSFGPYHHGKQHLKPMEHYNEVASRSQQVTIGQMQLLMRKVKMSLTSSLQRCRACRLEENATLMEPSIITTKQTSCA